MVSVVIADDDPLVRMALRTVLEVEDDITIVGDAADGKQAVAVVAARRPDVIMLDVRMPVLDGLEAARLIAAQTSTRVIMLTTFDLDEYIYAAMRGGASGFLLKDTSPERLAAAIRVVAAGDSLLAPAITKRLIERFTSHRPCLRDDDRIRRLTQRELDVLQQVARGRSNRLSAAAAS